MDCKTATPLLHAYLDGELDRRAVDELESHLEGCRECTRELAALEQLSKVVRQGALRHTAPASLRARLQSADESMEREAPSQKRGIKNLQWWAMAASVLFAFALGAGSTRWHASYVADTNAEQAFTHDLLASHLRALAAASPVDVVSSNRHTVKPWFAGKVGQSPPVRDFASEGFELVGGRIDYVGDQRVPVLVYNHGKHLIDVYMLPAKPGSAGGPPLMVQGYRLATVNIQGRSAWIVTDMDGKELARFSQLLASNEIPEL